MSTHWKESRPEWPIQSARARGPSQGFDKRRREGALTP